jgi:HlyD family secretion protein
MNSIAKTLKNPWLLALVSVATVTTIATAAYVLTQTKPPAPTVQQPTSSPHVSALGRLQPESEILKLAAPLALDGDRVLELNVNEGDRVTAGQIIAILDSRDRLQDEVYQSKEQVAIAQAKLAQVRAGAKTGELKAQESTIDRNQVQRQGDLSAQQESLVKLEAQWQGDRKAQQATIAKLKAELNNARAEYDRYRELETNGAISRSLLDTKRLTVETATQQVNEAQAVLQRIDATASSQRRESLAILDRTAQTGTTQIDEAKSNLDRIAEVRPVDIHLAQAEVNSAIAALKLAKTSLDRAYIRAPIAGQILKIHTRIGEKQTTKGIAELAQTENMIAIAEVYQTDIAKVNPGQSAIITSQGFSGELQGKVMVIERQVSQQKVFSNQPGENFDRRIIEVKIRLSPDAKRQVSGLTNLQVQTIIKTSDQTPP